MVETKEQNVKAVKQVAKFRVNFAQNKKLQDAIALQESVLNFTEYCTQVPRLRFVDKSFCVANDERTFVDPEVEFSFDIRSENGDWRHQLFPLLTLALRSIPPSLPPYLAPVITVPSRQTLENSLKPQHTGLRLYSVNYGNFINRGTLLNHYEVSFYSDRVDAELREHFQAAFVHDSSQLVVKFKNVEKRFKYVSNKSGFDEKKESREFSTFTLKVNYKHLKSVLVENCAVHNSKPVHRLHFSTTVPPEICKSFDEMKQQRERRGEDAYGDGLRMKDISRGRNRYERNEMTILSDCPVFSLTFDQMTDDILYGILARIYHKSGLQVEFGCVTLLDAVVVKFNKYERDSLGGKLVYYEPFRDRDMIILFGQRLGVRNWTKDMREKYFPLFYLFEALMHRGTTVKDQLCLSREQFWQFAEVVLREYVQDNLACEWALEELLELLSERPNCMYIRRAFLKLIRTPKDSRERLEREMRNADYVRIRKVVITPTRQLYVVPETMMGNRVIRRYGKKDGNHIIRVSFRDDDGGQMRAMTVGEKFLKEIVSDALGNGLTIAGHLYSYLGNSNSQMRDHGCYFIRGTKDDASHIRNKLGRFHELKYVPKVVARLGQCFTQSRNAQCTLETEDSSRKIDQSLVNKQDLVAYEYEYYMDVIGGSDTNGDEYTYSDGVGRISQRFISEMMSSMKVGKNYVPACIQFRFRGGKGILTQDPVLDGQIEFGRTLGFVDANGYVVDKIHKDLSRLRLHKVLFRDSQMKFRAPREKEMEIVKYCSPTPVSLNRPWINILDQVSELQSYATHQKVCSRIEELLDRHILNCSMVLIDEKACRNKLKELPSRLDIDRLSQSSGFTLSYEPFFRSLVKASVKYSLTKHLKKQQIPIPFDLGRSMFGIVDETGLLQYGQVFVKYTVNIGLKTPPKTAATRTLKGKILVTKNPCIVAGDVRVFEAVDLPELQHLQDVIVFPQHGPRPHPDEMAGSDLDGDEYSVVWDPQLLFDHNEPPMDFTKVKSAAQQVDMDRLPEQMIDYYITYMLQDSIGIVSNAFLVAADLYGLKSTVANRIAQKCSEAVDFPKTGVAPAKLTNKWEEEVEGSGVANIPPERSPRLPDFQDKDAPVYISPRMVGKIYRDVKFIQDVLSFSEEKDAQLSLELDPLIDVAGWEKYEEQAKTEYASYMAALRREMDHYGTKTEAEMMTGYILEMANRLSDKDNDDMSFFNTTHTIEIKVSAIWTEFRRGFFERSNIVYENGVKRRADPFGAYMDLTQLSDKYFADQENPLHRFVNNVTDEMKKKAVACYKVCYGIAAQTSAEVGRFLSFPWLVWDVLQAVKRDNLMSDSKGFELGGYDFYTKLSDHLERYCDLHLGELETLRRELYSFRAINVYCRVYDGYGRWQSMPSEGEEQQQERTDNDSLGLLHLIFCACRWAEKGNLFGDKLKPFHVALLLIKYAAGLLSQVTKVFIESLPLIPDEEKEKEEGAKSKLLESDDVVGEYGRRKIMDTGRMFVGFLQYIGSRSFRRLSEIVFDDLGVAAAFIDDEWVPLHEAAKNTYFSMVFSSRFEDLPLDDTEVILLPEEIREHASFTIELPPGLDEQQVEGILIEKCGLAKLKLRRLPGSRERGNRVRVSAMGNLHALKKLRNTLAVTPILNASEIGEELDYIYAQMTLENIMSPLPDEVNEE